MKQRPVKVYVYIDDGQVYSYEVPYVLTAQKDAIDIVARGYVQSDSNDEFRYYPPHRILKVLVRKEK